MHTVAKTLLGLSLTLLSLLPGGAQRAAAMVVVQRDFPELVARAEQIVIGTVSSVSELPDDSGVPWTLVTFADLTLLKGDVGVTLTLRFYGGRSGSVAAYIPDMPVFAVGERAMLFVAGNGRDLCPLVGVWQGRIRVRYDATLGTDVVETSDRQSVTLRSSRFVPLQAGATPAPMTLDEFRQHVADELARPTTVGEAIP